MTAKDERLYGKFTLDFPEHEKIVPLSSDAFRCLVEATLWSRKMETDGVLARRLALAKWSLEVLTELCTNDDEKPSLIETETGWLIRDFAEHQDTKAEIAARRERAKAAGQLGGLAKAKRGAKQTAKRTASKSLSKSLPETETETHKETTLVNSVVSSDLVTTGGGSHGDDARELPNGAGAPPPPKCSKHENPDHEEPCRACRAVRVYRDGEALRVEQQRAQRQQRRDEIERQNARAIRHCDMCDNRGEHRRGNARYQCPHDPKQLVELIATSDARLLAWEQEQRNNTTNPVAIAAW